MKIMKIMTWHSIYDPDESKWVVKIAVLRANSLKQRSISVTACPHDSSDAARNDDAIMMSEEGRGGLDGMS